MDTIKLVLQGKTKTGSKITYTRTIGINFGAVAKALATMQKQLEMHGCIEFTRIG